MTIFHHFTTIIPFGIDEQLEKLETWYKAHGQPIHALNHSREYAVVRDALPDWVLPMERRFAQRYGRDYLPFTQLLGAIRDKVTAPEDRVLLVNSDVSIADAGMIGQLDDPQTDLIFASRQDIIEDGQPSAIYRQGYDVFSLKRSAARVLDMPEFFLGIPWWDYILPLSTITAGYNVRRLDTDVFHHVVHPQRWSLVSFDHIGWECMRRLLAPELTAGGPSHDKVLKFAQVTNDFLNGPLLERQGETPPDEIWQSFTGLVDAEPIIHSAPAARRPVADRRQNRKGLDLMDNAAFADLLEQISSLKDGKAAHVKAGHVDLGPDLWLSADPEGQTEISVVPSDGGFTLGLNEGRSGGWACLGMRLSPAVLLTGRYLGLLITIRSSMPVEVTPSLRCYFADAPFVDTPSPTPLALPAGTHTQVVHIPLDGEALAAAEGGELNLFFHSDTIYAEILALEPLLLR